MIKFDDGAGPGTRHHVERRKDPPAGLGSLECLRGRPKLLDLAGDSADDIDELTAGHLLSDQGSVSQPEGWVTGATGRTWERRPARRRTDLLDAAERLFADQGLSATTVADITDAAGISKGSFYGYFPSKDALVEALNRRLGDDLFAVLDDVLSALVDDAARAMADGEEPQFGVTQLKPLLETAVARMVHSLLARRDLIEVWSREPSAAGASVHWLTRFVDRLAPWLGRDGHAGPGGRDAGATDTAGGVITCANPTVTALLVVHGIFGMVSQVIVLGDEIATEVLVASAQELAVRAFGLDHDGPS